MSLRHGGQRGACAELDRQQAAREIYVEKSQSLQDGYFVLAKLVRPRLESGPTPADRPERALLRENSIFRSVPNAVIRISDQRTAVYRGLVAIRPQGTSETCPIRLCGNSLTRFEL